MNNNKSIQLPVYFISDRNLAGTEAELLNIENQFLSKKEFELKLSYLKPLHSGSDNYDEWEQIISIVNDAKIVGDHAIILARSGHTFTADYSFKKLLQQILKANDLGAKILYTNAKVLHDPLYLSGNLFWIQDVSSTSFVVLYRSVFETILAHSDNEVSLDCFEVLLSGMTSNKLISYPFRGYQNNEGKEDYSITESHLKQIKLNTLKYKNGDFSHSSRSESIPKFTINGSIRAPNIYDSAEQVFLKGIREERMVILVPFYNAGIYLKQCFESLINQHYSNFKIVFLDDCSTDDALEEIPAGDQVSMIRGKHRSFALKNIYSCLRQIDCSMEDIIVIVDGDDYLYHNYVLKHVNYDYHKRDCLLSYGHYYATTKHLGHCGPYTSEEFDVLRQLDYRASHLKTFKFRLFEEYCHQDPEALAFKNDGGDFYEMTYDMALMTPLMEIAGFSRCHFNENINYIYRIHEKNDAARDRGLQVDIEREIRTKPGFKQSFL